ncbi:YagK/YfjJ domain-containing protein [Vibrio algarum]|uniref:Inovirus-type Gp2 protein n=1 Tax=Vibrio algarum TaxID=3020714 RepID=A0ABT4YSY8_9VIBR|nr:inovirus-type Gp2 protein [Vibrio sp. KJ40-1]MDB1124673.1 inovirus-type Gp2 protein [Vibrio sp. KJ40-1]
MSSDKAYQTHVYKDVVFIIYQCTDGMNYDFVDRACELIDFTLTKSKRVLKIRFDLHIKSNPNDNKLMSLFQKQLRREIAKLDHHGHYPIFEFMWVREQNTSPYPHYHCCLFLNNNAFRSDFNILKIARRLWLELAGGTIPYLSDNTYILRLDDPKTLQRAIYRVSYLAKWHGKKRGAPYRHFGSTNSKPNESSSWTSSNKNSECEVTLSSIPYTLDPTSSISTPKYFSIGNLNIETSYPWLKQLLQLGHSYPDLNQKPP